MPENGRRDLTRRLRGLYAEKTTFRVTVNKMLENYLKLSIVK